ncbi:MAG: CAP domain-containing protein [Verrucomicrobiota bacterium]|nr:CAP domain-containing protein [Verrucomicrobiota bacterium]
MNLARQNPQVYAGYVQELRATFDGNAMVLPGGTRLRTKEGVGAIDEAIRFLRSAQPLPPLVFSNGMSQAAADHCADQIDGVIGHGGSDRSNPAARLNRYGAWSLGWGENISYGKSTARDVVIALIVVDGLRERKHRKNIFSSKFACAGAAFGSHARYGAMCSIEFAGAYTEGNAEPSAQLLARNF